MKKFLAVYTGTAASIAKWKSMEEAARKEREKAGMEAWGNWMTTHAKSIVVEGGPVGRTKRTSAQGVADVTNNIAGYIVVQAESHEAAAKMFENHPHFAIFPGDAVEIMECLPIPGR